MTENILLNGENVILCHITVLFVAYINKSKIHVMLRLSNVNGKKTPLLKLN